MVQKPSPNLAAAHPYSAVVYRSGGLIGSRMAPVAATSGFQEPPVKRAPKQKLTALKVASPGGFDPLIFLETIGVGRLIVKHTKGEAIFLQGDPADAVFYVQSGKVQIMVVSEQGKEGVVSVLGAGDFFGEGCLAGQPAHIATATATADSVIGRIDKKVMIAALRDQPALSQMFMSYLLARNVQFEADLLDHLFNSSEKRLARVLLLLANIGKQGKMESVPNVNQEILAARVGTTRSRINFFMNKFRKLGFIEYAGSGNLKIHSSLLNVIVHD